MVSIIRDLVAEIKEHNYTAFQVNALQHRYHEERRWSVFDIIDNRPFDGIDDRDRAALWHVARGEITTFTGGIRIARDAVQLGHELAKTNPLGSTVAHIAGAWTGRYWLEEEAHHEVAFGVLLERAGLPRIETEETAEHRGLFPSDNLARAMVLQACVEVEVSVAYSEMAKTSKDPVIRDIFFHIMRDEVQHRQYFFSFAKALIDANVYPVKDILSMAYMWIKPGSGETHGPKREAQSERDGYVNWWETVRAEEGDNLALRDDQVRSPHILDKKIRSVLAGVRESTGIQVHSVKALEKAYFESLRTNDLARIQSVVDAHFPGEMAKAA